MHRAGTALAAFTMVMGVAALISIGPVTTVARAGDSVRSFEPRPLSQPVYDVRSPETTDNLLDPDPPRAGQRQYLSADDGTQLFVETYLPRQRTGGPVVADRLPGLMIITPYESSDSVFGTAVFVSTGGRAAHEQTRDFATYFATRGYAVSIAHLRGTGLSGGCFDSPSPLERADSVRFVHWAAEEARWSSGKVGLFGGSTPATAALEAAISTDPRARGLKAVVESAAITSIYAGLNGDGVPDNALAGQWPANVANDGGPRADEVPIEDITGVATRLAGRPGCGPAYLAPDNLDGDFNDWWADRELRRGMADVHVPFLAMQGFKDPGVYPVMLDGFFDQIPSATPRAGFFGQWPHEHPDFGGTNPGPQRGDWREIATAWFDRWVKGLPTKAESWPTVQVQNNEGEWRADHGFPNVSGTPGTLALGSDCTLGAPAPAGTTTFNDASTTLTGAAGCQKDGLSAAVFETKAPLGGALRISGTPHLDLWVKLDKPDAHVVATLEALDAKGNPVFDAPIEGRRSAQHLAPYVDGRFEQRYPVPAPVQQATLIPLRLTPVDLVVPKGGRLRLTVAGVCVGTACATNSGGTKPSGAATKVEILHDCGTRVSALRFTLPPADRDVLAVKPHPNPAPRPIQSDPAEVDGGGIATATPCE